MCLRERLPGGRHDLEHPFGPGEARLVGELVFEKPSVEAPDVAGQRREILETVLAALQALQRLFHVQEAAAALLLQNLDDLLAGHARSVSLLGELLPREPLGDVATDVFQVPLVACIDPADAQPGESLHDRLLIPRRDDDAEPSRQLIEPACQHLDDRGLAEGVF